MDAISALTVGNGRHLLLRINDGLDYGMHVGYLLLDGHRTKMALWRDTHEFEGMRVDPESATVTHGGVVLLCQERLD